MALHSVAVYPRVRLLYGACVCAGRSRLYVRNRDAEDMISALGLDAFGDAEAGSPSQVTPIASSIPRAVWAARTALISGSSPEKQAATVAFAPSGSRPHTSYSVGSRSSVSTYLPLSVSAEPARANLGPASRIDRSRSMAPLSTPRLSAAETDDDLSMRSDSWVTGARMSRDGKSMDSSFRPSDAADVFSDAEPKAGEVAEDTPLVRSDDPALAAVIHQEREKLEAIIQAPISKVFVFVAGDLNYRLDVTPDQAIRAVARAANDPVRARCFPLACCVVATAGFLFVFAEPAHCLAASCCA